MKHIYIDQSCSSALLENDNWKETNLGVILNEFQSKKLINVWISSQNALETSIWENLKERQKLSKVFEELTEGKRCYPSSEFVILREMLNLIKVHWPESNVDLQVFNELSSINTIVYSGVLAHMALITNYEKSPSYVSIVRTKLLSQLLQLEFLIDPVNKLELLNGDRKLIEEDFKRFEAEYGHLNIEELKNIIRNFVTSLPNKKIDKKIVSRLERNREKIIDRFIEDFIYPPICAILNNPLDFIKLIEIGPIIKNWDRVYPESVKGQPEHILELPNDLMEREKSNTLIWGDYYDLLLILSKRYKNLITIPRLTIEICLKEIEKSFRNQTPPTKGLTIDLDHAAMIYLCDIFYTQDPKLAATMKTWIKKMKFKKGYEKYCVSSYTELERLLIKIT